MLWRLTHGEHELLEISVDPDIHALAQMDKAIRHDVHKMRAFVRFRTATHGGDTWYVAWFEPEHHIVELNAPFFVDRFAQMHWSILTPDRCAHWDGRQLTFTEGVPKSEAPRDDAVEPLWQKYYAHIFNPARVKIHAMTKEMPKRYWKNLPEAQLIPELLQKAPARVNSMMAKSRASSVSSEFKPAPVPDSDAWTVVKKAACGCTACPLYQNATQTVFGEGSPRSELVFIGEQPGDSEDLAGKPFVGPAGQLLDRALEDAGIDRQLAYVTNAVKHFKWTPSGKRRLHKTPSPREVAACRPWLEAEIAPRAAEDRRLPRQYRGAGGAWARGPRPARPRHVPRVVLLRTDLRHRPPVLAPARARRGLAHGGLPPLRRRSEKGRTQDRGQALGQPEAFDFQPGGCRPYKVE